MSSCPRDAITALHVPLRIRYNLHESPILKEPSPLSPAEHAFAPESRTVARALVGFVLALSCDASACSRKPSVSWEELISNVDRSDKSPAKAAASPAAAGAAAPKVPAAVFFLDDLAVTNDAGAANIARNGSLDKWSADGAVPTNWTVAGSPKISKSTQCVTAASLCAGVETGEVMDQGLMYAITPVSPNTRYKISFAYKIDKGQLLVRIDDEGNNLYQGKPLPPGAWQRFDQTVQTSPGATKLTIYMRSGV